MRAVKQLQPVLVCEHLQCAFCSQVGITPHCSMKNDCVWRVMQSSSSNSVQQSVSGPCQVSHLLYAQQRTLVEAVRFRVERQCVGVVIAHDYDHGQQPPSVPLQNVLAGQILCEDHVGIRQKGQCVSFDAQTCCKKHFAGCPLVQQQVAGIIVGCSAAPFLECRKKSETLNKFLLTPGLQKVLAEF